MFTTQNDRGNVVAWSVASVASLILVAVLIVILHLFASAFAVSLAGGILMVVLLAISATIVLRTTYIARRNHDVAEQPVQSEPEPKELEHANA